MQTLFQYQNYREYLKDYYEAEKAKKTGFTYAKFSTKAGLGSPNYLKLIIDGKKNLTTENVIKFSKALSMSLEEVEYFESLVAFNQAHKTIEREFYTEKLSHIRLRHEKTVGEIKELYQHEFEAISHYLYLALMVMTNLKDFQANSKLLKDRLFDLYSESEIESVLQKLELIGLIKKDKSGKFKQTFRQVKTKPEVQKTASKLFYESLLKRAIQSFEITPPEEREFGAFVVGMSESQLPELKKKVRHFLKNLNEWALENPKPKQVYALCFSGFPLSTKTQKVFL